MDLFRLLQQLILLAQLPALTPQIFHQEYLLPSQITPPRLIPPYRRQIVIQIHAFLLQRLAQNALLRILS